MSQNTCRKALVIRPEEDGAGQENKDPGETRKKAPVESFWAFVRQRPAQRQYRRADKATPTIVIYIEERMLRWIPNLQTNRWLR